MRDFKPVFLALALTTGEVTSLTSAQLGALGSAAIAGLVEVGHPGAGVLPEVRSLRAVSATVAVAVARQAEKDGVAKAKLADPVQAVQDAMWHAEYRPLPLVR